MRKFFFAAICSMMFASINAQDVKSYTCDGNTYKATSNKQATKQGPIATTYSWELKDGTKLPILLSPNGRAYVVRSSKKTGNEYKQYLPEDVSRDICKKMCVEYIEKK